jgi:hypothetical protein
MIGSLADTRHREFPPIGKARLSMGRKWQPGFTRQSIEQAPNRAAQRFVAFACDQRKFESVLDGGQFGR